MDFLEWLFEKSPDENTPPPRVTPPVAAVPPWVIDDKFEEPNTYSLELEPVFAIIDYQDANGNDTRRRITMRTLSTGPRAPLLTAICHERRALRHFRTDRIGAFIDGDTGEVTLAPKFFLEIMDIDLGDFGSKPEDIAASTAAKIRDRLRPALSILTATARADDFLHPAEMDVIVKYVQDEIAELTESGDFSDEVPNAAYKALPSLLSKMRPQRSSLHGYLESVATYRNPRASRFLNAIEDLIIADGVVVPEEIELLRSIGLEVEKIDQCGNT